jgi:hypothetical protein
MQMRFKLFLCVLVLASAAYAKDLKAYQRGQLLQMDSVDCGGDAKAGQCLEYVLEAEKVVYRIRPRSEKHPVLLPIGGEAQFRFGKDQMLVRVDELDSREREYFVVSITPRSDASKAEASTPRLNHLQ